jgi:hypothetical protein
MSGQNTADQVPARYDVILDGYGYVTARAIDPNFPFRTQQVALSYTPTFLERTNVAAGYGDNQQSFYLTVGQDNWNLGDGQRYLRSADQASSSRFYQSTNIDITDPGQAKLRPAVVSTSLAGTVTNIGTAIGDTGYLLGSTSLISGAAFASTTWRDVFSVDMTTGVSTHQGIVSPGVTGSGGAMTTDGVDLYISGTSGVQRFTPGTGSFAFSSVGSFASSMCFVSNTLFAFLPASGQFGYFSSAGAWNTASTFKRGQGSANSVMSGLVVPFGGKVALLVWPGPQSTPDLYTGDTSGVSQTAQLPPNFTPYDMKVVNGVIFISGTLNAVDKRSAVYYYANGNLGLLWESPVGGVTVLQPFATALSALSPTIYYPLADAVGSATAADASGNGYTGSLVGGVTFGQTSLIPGDSNTAALLNGSTGYVQRTFSLSWYPTTAVTMSAWVKFSALPASGKYTSIIALSDLHMSVDSRGVLYYFVIDGTGNALKQIAMPYPQPTITPGRAFWVAITDDGTTTRLYFNGEAFYSTTSSAVTGARGTHQDLRVGTSNLGGGAGTFLNGVVDDVAVWKDIALTETQIGSLWASRTVLNPPLVAPTVYSTAVPLGKLGDGLLIYDTYQKQLLHYNAGTGGTAGIATLGASDDAARILSGTNAFLAVGQTNTPGRLYYTYPANTFSQPSFATSGTVTTSLIDFDNSLPKLFSAVRIEWANAAGDSGGTVDVSYQIESVEEAFTPLATGVSSGESVSFPPNTTGASVSIKVTLNKGASMYGPVLKRVYVRAVGLLDAYRMNQFILDLGGTPDNPLRLRDGSESELTGAQMLANLQATITAKAPVTITDQSGTYTGVMEPATCEADMTRPGQWYARVTVREV